MKTLPSLTKKDLLTQLSEINDSDRLKKALEIAAKGHEGQLRDGGGKYLNEHIYYVTSLLYEGFKNDKDIENLVVLALLHDSVEDGGIKVSFLEKVFDKYIADTVSLLSKTPKEEDDSLTQDQKYMVTQNYLNRLSRSRGAVIVKLYDRIGNLNCTVRDTIALKPEKYMRYLKETKNLFIPLAKKYDFKKIVSTLESEVDRIEKLFN
ncbi:MAG: HD domain-containing protein [Candidatus Dojkabacteria bacterium]|jgi:guanosine-3',5'-bis(diphosphate) 3'-pyrophosphohydrolase